MGVSALPDGSLHYDEPYFVTPHALRRYRERVDADASDREIIRRVNVGLQEAGPSDGTGYPPDRPIALGVPGEFTAIVEPPQEKYGTMPSVVTIWGWGICPHLLRRKGGPNVGYRFYRWLSQ